MRRLMPAVALAAALALCGTAVAAAPPQLDGSQLAASRCGAHSAPLVNVVYGLTNDYDSAVGGGAWANDSIRRHLQIWQVDGGYCATAQDVGLFTTFAGTSPSGAATVSAGVHGVIDGGYRSTVFQGAFAPGAYATHGYLGSFDVACATGCGGAHPTPTAYFSSTSGFDLAWWGWIYRAGSHGTWLNAVGGNVGDVTG